MVNTYYNKHKVKIINLILGTNRRILNLENTKTFTKIKYLKSKSKRLLNKMYRLAQEHIINHFICNIKKSTSFTITNRTEKLKNKFETISQQQTKQIYYNKDWLVNLTQHIIPQNVEMILALRPKFAVT